MQKYSLMRNLPRKDIHLDLCVGERKTGRVFGQAMIFVLGSISPWNVSEASKKRPFRPSWGGKDDGNCGCPTKYQTFPNINTIFVWKWINMEKSTQKTQILPLGIVSNAFIRLCHLFPCFFGGIAHVNCVTDIAHVNHAAIDYKSQWPTWLNVNGWLVCLQRNLPYIFSWTWFVFCNKAWVLSYLVIHIFRFTVIFSNLYTVLPLAPGWLT